MRPLLKKLMIQVNKVSDRNKIIVRSLFNALNSIGKTSKEKDKRATRRVITTSIVRKQLRKAQLIRQTCVDLSLNRKTLSKALALRSRLDSPLGNDLGLLVVGFHELIRI